MPQVIQAKRLQVLLRGGDVLMPEERLQRLDVDAGLQHLRGEGVPPLVQVEPLAVRSVAAFSLLCFTAFEVALNGGANRRRGGGGRCLFFGRLNVAGKNPRVQLPRIQRLAR